MVWLKAKKPLKEEMRYVLSLLDSVVEEQIKEKGFESFPFYTTLYNATYLVLREVPWQRILGNPT